MFISSCNPHPHHEFLQLAASKQPGKAPQFVKAGGAEANKDEISLDDDDTTGKVVEQAVPAAVFGGISAESTLGAKARFQAKAQ